MGARNISHTRRWPFGLGNPLEWDPADKCLLSALIVLPFTTYYAALAWWVPQHPEFAPYVNGSFVGNVILPIQIFLVIPGWLFIAALAVRQRGACRLDGALVHAVAQLFFGWFGFASYVLGSNTSLYPAVILLGGATFGLAMFERRPVLFGIGTFGAIVLVGLALSLIGVVPYAPALRSAPYDSGRLELSWLIGLGGAEASTLVAALAIICYVIDRWRDREYRFAHVSALIRQYVPHQVAQEITAGHYAAVEEHRRSLITLVFADIKDFTAISDSLAPVALSTLLNRYMAEMTMVANRHGGTIDKFMGDEVMVIFGAPADAGGHEQAMAALTMAIEMQGRAAELAPQWQDAGATGLAIRIGVNTGLATVGNFGSPGRVSYTAVGTEVNLAARLQTVCSPGGILISEATRRLVGDEIDCRYHGALRLRGLRSPVETYYVDVPGSALRAD